MECSCNETTVDSFLDDCPYLTASYILAGLSMMLNIRLAYSSAPYALIRFRLPENLFSVFVRRMASALELWCLPSMLLGNIIDVAMKLSADKKSEFQLTHSKLQTAENAKLGKLIDMKQKKFNYIIIPSILTMWSDFITYVVLLIVYIMGDQGNVTAYYGVIAVSGFIFGINMTLVYAADWRYIPVYIAGENAFPMLTSIIHYFATLMFGNRRKYNSDFIIVNIDIWVAIIISFTTAILWTSAYCIMEHTSEGGKIRFNVLPGLHFTSAYGTEGNPANDSTNAVTLNKTGGSGEFASKATITITRTKEDVDLSSLNVSSSESLEISISSGTIKNKDNTLTIGSSPKTNDVLELDATGNITKPATNTGKVVTLKGTIVVTSNDKQIGSTLQFGGNGNSGGVTGSVNLQNATDGSDKKHVNITGTNLIINETAYNKIADKYKTPDSIKIGTSDSTPRNPSAPGATDENLKKYWHLLPPNYYDEDFPYWTSTFPALMIMVGMGFVYCIYPGIAPGMIVPFYLVDKIETVLLVLTTFPPVIIAILQKHKGDWSPKYNNFGKFQKWTDYEAGKFYLFLDIIMVIKLSLLGIFIYCLHYRDSHISISIINQPKMSTFLTIVFYMCHEMLLALGFSGFIGNNGGDFILIPQYVGALLMIFLAFYSEGYIIEYKSNDPAHWPTEGMWYLYG